MQTWPQQGLLPGKIILKPSKTIAVIVRDEALLASLSFALGVEGFLVEGSRAWPAGLDARADLACIILDSENYRVEAAARGGLDAAHRPILFLSDALSPVPDHAGVSGIAKPFQGNELVETVRRLAVA